MRRIACLFILSISVASLASADVRTEEKTQVKLEGALGRMMAIFGGRGARDGIVSSVAVKGDRKMTTTDRTAQLVDLAEEKVYDIDLAKKTYTVMTFAEMRQRFEESRKKAAEQASRQEEKRPADPNAPQYQIDFDLKDTGQKQTINGFDTHEVVMTIAMHEKGKALVQNGGMVITTSMWLAPKMPNMKDVAEFDRRFAEKLALPTLADPQQMAAAMAMYPMLADGLKRMQAESVRMDGMPVMTTSRIEAVAAPGEAQSSEPAKAKQEEAPPRSLGGLGGALARRALKNREKEKEADAAPATPGRATIMTMQHELLKVTPSATDADVALPAGFKQRS
jgi:hypothetical protein